MEEFRAPVAEALGAHMLSTGQLGPENFDDFPIRGEDGIWMVDGGAGKVLRAYEKYVDKRVKNPATGEWTTWRGLMDFQIDCYVRHVMDEADYRHYRMDM